MKRLSPVAFSCLLFLSCSFFSMEREYCVHLPALPGGYDFADRWDVEILTGTGALRRVSLPCGDSLFRFSAAKEESLIILARARGPEAFSVKPAGLYLDGHGRDEGCLSFEDGPALLVLRNALVRGFDLRGFNISRFLREWGRNDPASPWFMDLEGITESVVAGEFSLYKIRNAPLFPLQATAGADEWISEDPFLGDVFPSFLPAGRHRFYCPHRSLLRVLSLDEKGGETLMDYSVNGW